MKILSQVYFITKPYFLEALTTFSFRSKVNWIEEGMSLLSWKYQKVSDSSIQDLDQVYKFFKNWDGNDSSLSAGHRSISVGDIVLSGDKPYLVIGGGWVAIPQQIWKRIGKIK